MSRFFILPKFLPLLFFIFLSFFSFNFTSAQDVQDFLPPGQLSESGGTSREQTQNFLDEEDEKCKTKYGSHTKYSGKDGGCIDDSGGPLWKCTFGLIGAGLAGCLSSIADWTIGLLFQGINLILNAVLAFAMWVLDVVMYITVVKFRTNFVDLNLSGLGGVLIGSASDGLIYYIWGILRDFVNLLLLITIIYYAVKTMFDGFEGSKNKFIFLLLFSIIINFSLFFVKFAIDVSNILTLQAYTLLAEPKSFNSWSDFRVKQAGPNGKTPATIGEYLLNITSIAPIVSEETGKAAAAQRITEGMKGSWVYQVGVFLIYLGLIYMLFFLIGLYVMRAAAFVFAMILAALLAADIFFNSIVGNQGGKEYEFATSIKKVTDKIRDDFYEALIRGPVLLLFLFLVGILANAIFNQSITAEITNLAVGSKEFKVLGTAVGQSIALILKFLIFFALTKVLFDKLAEIKFGDGKTWLMAKSGGALGLATRTLGLGSRGVGYLGQNTVGRWASNRDSFLGRNLNRFNNADWVQNWKNADGGTIRGRFQRRIGGAITGSIKGIKDGSYDLVGSANKGYKKLDEKIGGRISKVVKGVEDKTFNFSQDVDFGPGVTTTRDQRDQAAADERKKKRDAELAATEHSNLVTSEDYLDASREIKIKDAGDISLETFENLLAKKVSAVRGSAAETFVNSYNFGDAKVRLQVKEARDKADSKAAEAAHHRDEHTKEELQKKYLSGERKAETYVGMVKDVGSGRGLGNMRDGLKVDTASKSKKGMQAEAKKFPVVLDVKRDLDSTIKEIDNVLHLETLVPGTLTTDQVTALNSLRTKIDEDIIKINIPLGNPTEAQRVAIVESFAGDKDLRSSVVKNKNDVANLVGVILDPANTTVRTNLKNQRDSMYDDFKDLESTSGRTSFLATPYIPTGAPPGTAPRVATGKDYAMEVRLKESGYKRLDKLLNEGVKSASEIAQRAKKNEEAIKAQFEAKPEEKH